MSIAPENQHRYALVQLDAETSKHMDITLDQAEAEKWYKEWELELSEGELMLSQKYSHVYMLWFGEVDSKDQDRFQVGQKVHYTAQSCPLDSCQDWIAGPHDGEILFTGNEDECQDAMLNTEPLIKAWIHPLYC